MLQGFGPSYVGANMLVPQPYDPQWTKIDDGIFNAYPPPPPGSTVSPNSTAGQIAQVIRRSGVPVPNGPVEWNNPTTAATLPITPSVSTNNPVLNGNRKRNFLAVQNASRAATSADVAPDLLVNFASRVIAGVAAIRLSPGVGLILDYIVPRDDIYVAWDLSAATGTYTQGGSITQGAHSPDGVPDWLAPAGGGGGGGVGFVGHESNPGL